MLAIERLVAGNGNQAVVPLPQQDSADLSSAAGQRKERVHHRQPDIVQHAGRVFNPEWALGCVPLAQCGLGAVLHASY